MSKVANIHPIHEEKVNRGRKRERELANFSYTISFLGYFWERAISLVKVPRTSVLPTSSIGRQLPPPASDNPTQTASATFSFYIKI
jgi:hypothetical protein